MRHQEKKYQVDSFEEILKKLDELGIEVQLEEQLSGFSLFGWLAKLLAN